jgi:subtilisin family serine protease
VLLTLAACAVLTGGGLLVGSENLASAAGFASAATSADWWYYDDTGVKQAIAAGYDGKGIKIAVIDGQIDPSLPELRSVAHLTIAKQRYCSYPRSDPEVRSGVIPATATPKTAFDVTGLAHGTSIAALLVGTGKSSSDGRGIDGVAPQATLMYYAVEGDQAVSVAQLAATPDVGKQVDTDGCVPTSQVTAASAQAQAIKDAVAAGAQIISLSSANAAQDRPIHDAIAQAIAAGVIVADAMPDDQTVEQDGDLAMFRVRPIDAKGNLAQAVASPNPNVNMTAPGVDIATAGINTNSGQWTPIESWGTSFATPILAGMVADIWSRYPAATGWQIMQSVVRNATQTDQDAYFDPNHCLGFGAVGYKDSFTRILNHDPTKYPSINPFSGSDPTVAVLNAPTASKTKPAKSAKKTDSVPIIIAAAALVAILVLITIIFFKRKKRRGRQNKTAPTFPSPMPNQESSGDSAAAGLSNRLIDPNLILPKFGQAPGQNLNQSAPQIPPAPRPNEPSRTVWPVPSDNKRS